MVGGKIQEGWASLLCHTQNWSARGLDPSTCPRIHLPAVLPINFSVWTRPFAYFANKGTLHSFDSRQCLLLKLELGLSKYSPNTALLESLEIRSISEQYYLHKLLFRNQINANLLARAVFDRLIETSYSPNIRSIGKFLQFFFNKLF